MNTFLKDKILKNENILLINFPEYKQSITQFIGKIEKIKYDGVLYEMIKSSFKSDKKKNQIRAYIDNGFISSLEILDRNIEHLDLNDKPILDQVLEGKIYNQYDICSMANNYNNQIGMYYINKSNVIIKSTVEDNNRKYDDRWFKTDIILKYFMQKEKECNLKKLVFSYSPNAIIFSALMEGTLINIHTFINTKSGDDYVYKGVFHPCGILNNNKAFILFKKGYEFEIPFDNLELQSILSLFSNNVFSYSEKINIILYDKNKNFNLNNQIEKIKTSKRNIIQQMKIKLQVDLRGEWLIVYYEKSKLIMAGHPELADLVENVSLVDSSLGFDVKSFDVLSDGCINQIFIKVQTSVSDLIQEYNLTNFELNNLLHNPETYKLYRVFDIYTDKPKIQIVTKPLNETFDILPISYNVWSKT